MSCLPNGSILLMIDVVSSNVLFTDVFEQKINYIEHRALDANAQCLGIHQED